MKYLKRCKKETDYTAFKNSTDWVLPNISFIEETHVVKFNSQTNLPPSEPETPQPIALCDIVYWDGSKMQTSSWSAWEPSFGTPVGVVVIPEGFMPDGKARMISLKPVDKSGNPVSTHTNMTWGAYGNDTTLTNYNRIPKTDNTDSAASASITDGYLPSDKFTVTQSYVDSLAKYNSSSNYIPSPYLGSNTSFNAEYNKSISGYNNALSDFNGHSNTQKLAGLGSSYEAACAAWKYKDNVSNTQWYLPAMGELGFLMPRFNAINTILQRVGGIALDDSAYFWSSSEFSTNYAYCLRMSSGYVNYINKSFENVARPFAIVEV
jgi:hypothetical protein